ncbi:MAG: hypothetical protein H0T62_09025 [Parachlamydiaceae bacterium]|nr:hypothetical protein [Parachlamydiaceae bacterium]
MLKATLNDIKKFLEIRNYPCTILNKSEFIPVEQLVIELMRDSKERARLLLVRATQQNLSASDALLGIKSKIRIYQEIQFIVTLPFQVVDEQIPDAARLILLLNKGLELPGFELSESDRLIFFRHAFVVPEDDLDERIFLSLVGMIELVLDAFAETLEKVATGKQSLREVIEEAKTLMVSAAPGDSVEK